MAASETPGSVVRRPAGAVPDAGRVAAVAAIDRRVIRNLEITECYAELSDAMRVRTGDAANWCTFATWASRQAGSTIRGEDLIERLEQRLGESARLFEPLQSINRVLLRKGLYEPDTGLGGVVARIHTPFDAFERASEAVAAGNLKVFEEIGRLFARFVAEVSEDAAADSAEFRAFAAELRPGPPPDGQDYLREAFAHYQQQRHETDPAARAAWILLANLKIGLHEQTRLQPQIAAAVDAPLATAVDLGERVLHHLFPGAGRWPHMARRASARMLGWLAKGLHALMSRLTREIVTESMMVLALPNAVLALGRNLEAPVPPVFADNAHPALARFVRTHDPCPSGGGDCGASDWCDLGQRMHYILHLFRAYAFEPALFARPFTDAQVSRFRAGVVPDGEL